MARKATKPAYIDLTQGVKRKRFYPRQRIAIAEQTNPRLPVGTTGTLISRYAAFSFVFQPDGVPPCTAPFPEDVLPTVHIDRIRPLEKDAPMVPLALPRSRRKSSASI